MPVAAPLVLRPMLETFIDPPVSQRVRLRIAGFAGIFTTMAEFAWPDPGPERDPGKLVAAFGAVARAIRSSIRDSRRDITD